MLFFLLTACSWIDRMESRAETSTLVCYNEGTLIYASETTISEMQDLETKYRQDIETWRVEMKEWADEVVRSRGSNNTPEARRNCEFIVGKRLDAGEPAIESCEPKIGTGERPSPRPDFPRSPRPVESKGSWSFIDKGVLFESKGATCFYRGPLWVPPADANQR